MESKTPLRKEIRTMHPIQNLFLMDVLRERDSRPAIFWALGTLLIGTLAYHWLEGWSFLDSLYFCVVSLATVGYGDYTPTTSFAKLFTIGYLVNGLAILLALFDRIRTVRSQRIGSLVERRTGG
jgi:hypothetical protein